jgi:hypothetical protein
VIGPQKPPHAIEALTATGEQPTIVACLGSSSTAGKGKRSTGLLNYKGDSAKGASYFVTSGWEGTLPITPSSGFPV